MAVSNETRDEVDQEVDRAAMAGTFESFKYF
jgi:hypothetical protein